MSVGNVFLKNLEVELHQGNYLELLIKTEDSLMIGWRWVYEMFFKEYGSWITSRNLEKILDLGKNA